MSLCNINLEAVLICYRLHVQYSAPDVSTSLYTDRYLDNNPLMKDVFIKTINRLRMIKIPFGSASLQTF